MADTGKQSPLGVNSLSTLLSNTGLQINPVFAGYVGRSQTISTYALGTVCNNTCLRLLTYAIRDGYDRGVVDAGTYLNLITIGANVIPALGNSKPNTFTWEGPANTGDSNGTPDQEFSWNPYEGEITSWGYIRLLALQGWNEFDYNNGQSQYRDFLSSFMMASSFTDYSNQAIMAVQNSKTFLDGTYSNMNDLMSADILGVNLATPVFGLDLIDLGKAIDLRGIDTFGLPSKLLLTLQKYNAITASLSLALQSTDLTTDEISFLLGNTGTPTPSQEYSVYQAFTIIGSLDLADILVTLNCKTRGLTTLADLLNVKMLFPRSYSSLTVPIYNTTLSNVNSKIYYPIYVGNSVNANLTSPAVLSAVGSVIPTSLPAIVTSVTTARFTPQEPAVGFGSYLQDILPSDVAIAAGALSASMLQIKNIQAIPIEKFAQVVVNIETTSGLLVNGTSVPVNAALADEAAATIALGSGPFGTYTTSNFFGCMSGLPYDVARIQEIMSWVRDVPGESAAGGDSLYDIYKNLYLKVTWERATITVTYTTEVIESPPATFTTWYTPTGYTYDVGGGYGFGGAVAPALTSNCGTGTPTIGTDKNNIATFGRVDPHFSMTTAPQLTIPTATIGFPPGSGAFSNTDVQTYITQANTEIAALRARFPIQSGELNVLWDSTGTQLTLEQQARSICFAPVPTPRDNNLSRFPTTQYSFVDSIPRYALNTAPHMYAQTIEAICDWTQVGGQSIVGMMRQERNQVALSIAGIPLDNNIPVTIQYTSTSALIANGTLPEAVAGTGINVNGVEFTVPATLAIVDPVGNVIVPVPVGTYSPDDNTFVPLDPLTSTPVDAIIDPGTGILLDPLTGLPIDSTSPGTGYPGSLGGSDYVGIIPPNVNTDFTSRQLTPSTQTPAQALGEVTTNNCDCWNP